MKTIPTIYKETTFRSKLEAQWAKWFDGYKILWRYEEQGFDIDGIWYLPDFFLPEINTIIEVKGLLKNIPKAQAFWNALEKLNILKDPESHWWQPSYLFLLGGSPPPYFFNINGDSIYIGHCTNCGKYFFCYGCGSYGCRCCGTHYGDDFLVDDLPLLSKPIDWLPAQKGG